MSDRNVPKRIRAQSSPGDGNLMGFVLDAPVQNSATPQSETPKADAPLSRALLGITGVDEIEVAGAAIWVRKTETTDWITLKPAIAAVIRKVLNDTDQPLGDSATDQDSILLRAVESLLDKQVNPSVAAHGGHIAVERVEDGTVYLRMSGGCQGCPASSATLRQGVERMLRAALPEIQEIVDVTDHDEGRTPFYARDTGASPLLDRAVPPGVIDWQDGQIVVDPDYLAPRLGLTAGALRAGLRNGDVVGATETGLDEDKGKTRIVLRSPTRTWAAEIRADGTAREIPAPRQVSAAAQQEDGLAERVRAHLASLSGDPKLVTYGALARALGLWAPGSVRKVTRALETTMRQDARTDRPFIAARAVSRGAGRLPGKGFFDLAHALSRGPEPGESDNAFHARELGRITNAPRSASGARTA